MTNGFDGQAPKPCPDLMSASMSVALPAIPSLHLGQMQGERPDLRRAGS